MVYRFGIPEMIELEYPEEMTASWKAFEYAFYLRGGGPSNAGLDLNYLSFSNGGWKYVIYQEYSAETGSTDVGIRLIQEENSWEFDIPGTADSVVGSLIFMRQR